MRDDRSSLPSGTIATDRSTTWWRMLFELSPGLLCSIDRNGRFVDANRAWLEATGYSRSEVLGQSALFPLSDKSARYAFEHVLPTLWEKGHLRDVRFQYRCKNGELLDVLLDCNVVVNPESGDVVSLCYVRDITTLMRSERALRESEERFALAVRGANDGIWDWTLGDGAIYFSPRFSEMLGYREGGFGSTAGDWLAKLHPDDRTEFELALQKHLHRLAPSFECECRVRTHEGAYRWMRVRGVAVRDQRGHAYRIAGSQADIHEQRLAYDQLRYDALHDRLTGLPNRTLFVEHLNNALSRWRRDPRSAFAVVLLDLDRFKMINDSLGHVLGDELLVAAALRLQSCLRDVDTLARFGGDEFAILLEPLDSVDHAQRAVDAIHACLTAPFEIGGTSVYTSCTAGICISARGYVTGDELMRDADIALYRAKAARIPAQIFARPMHALALEQLQLETDLRRAVLEQRLYLVYQPIVDTEEARIRGFEALLRWDHEQQGAIAPSAFIPVAEETGLIHQLGEWVLRQACEQLVTWTREAPASSELYVSVNISSRQLLAPSFVESVQRILDETGVAADRVWLELTETALVDDSGDSLLGLTRLRELGLHICLDDFGTGYSSLSYLHRYPIDVLKIDRSFVTDLDSERNTALVSTILSLGRHLDKTVVAEGVETLSQLEALRRLSCPLAQGYYLSYPLDANDARALLETGHLTPPKA